MTLRTYLFVTKFRVLVIKCQQFYFCPWGDYKQGKLLLFVCFCLINRMNHNLSLCCFFEKKLNF